MNNGEKISNAIGRIDQRYVSEYIKTVPPRSHRRATLVTAAAATLAVVLLLTALPAMLGHDDGRLPDIPSINGLNYELSTASDGSQVVHAINAHLDTDARQAGDGRWNISVERAYAWKENIAIVQSSESPNSLMFSGIPQRVDTYCFDRQVEYTEKNGTISYDVVSGQTTVDTLPGQPDKTYMRTQRTVCHIATVHITNIYNNTNNTGYNSGDVIYIYSEYSYYPTDDAPAADEISSDIRIACASSSDWGQKIGGEYVFVAYRSSRTVSDAVLSAGIISNVNEMWGVSASCTLEGYNNGNYYQTDSRMWPVEE